MTIRRVTTTTTNHNVLRSAGQKNGYWWKTNLQLVSPSQVGETKPSYLVNDSQAVVALQETLDGCYGQHLATDGDYGPLTQAAVEVAQRAAHVTADGVYGPVTRDHINWWDFGDNCAKL